MSKLVSTGQYDRSSRRPNGSEHVLNLGEEMAGRIERSRHEPSLARGRLAAGVDHHFRHRQNVQPAFEGIGDIAKWSEAPRVS